MQSSATRDFIVGLFVLGGLLAVGYLSTSLGGLSYKGDGGFELVAIFDDIGGLSERSPVKISGVKVGQVAEIALDEDLRARATAQQVAQMGVRHARHQRPEPPGFPVVV